LLCLENARALSEAGAQGLTVHCRTKKQGYAPPAHWEWLPLLQEAVPMTPITANGDIRDFQSLKKCQEISGLQNFMIGRQALKNPHVFNQIRKPEIKTLAWPEKQILIWGFYTASKEKINSHYALARTKQFLRNLSFECENSKNVFDQTKILMKPQIFEPALERALYGKN
ncbi:MAG: tRNA-dihydrouridine synthase family protein, partial [Bdellovibrionales bacterium]